MRLEYPGKKPPAEIMAQVGAFVLQPVDGHGNIPLDGWRNMLIQGDNLEALRLLLQDPAVRGNVRLVYIDPPFSTNQVFRAGRARAATVSRSASDRVAYQDTRTGADYIEFLRERLVLLREILADDGAIYVHIDCKIGHYVKIIMADDQALIKALLKMPRFPVKDPYVAFLRRSDAFLESNPGTVRRPARRVHVLGFPGMISALEEPKEFNRQIGTL